MPFFKSLPPDAGPPDVFTAYPEIYGPWAETSQALMNGPSPLTPGERELIAAYVAGLTPCEYAFVAHSAAAGMQGVDEEAIRALLSDPDAAPVADELKPLLAFVRKLTLAPADMTQADADAAFAAGWDEKALHDAIAVTARMCFMSRLVEGHGFVAMDAARARDNARRRVALGYRDMYPAFAGGGDRSADDRSAGDRSADDRSADDRNADH